MKRGEPEGAARNRREVRSHYNQRGKKPRDDATVNLRAWNNCFKAGLIEDFTSKGSVVADLGAGRGGDLLKYDATHVSTIYHVDDAEGVIAEAQSRHVRQGLRSKLVTIRAGMQDQLPIPSASCDAVFTQFSFHYVWGSREQVEATLDTIGRVLKKGGTWICTTMDKGVLYDSPLHHRGEAVPWRGDVAFGPARLTMDSEDHVFGTEVRVTLGTALVDCPEFLVDPDSMKALARERGLQLCNTVPFTDMDPNHPRCRKMRVRPLSDADARAAGMYCAYVFLKE